MSWDVPTEHDCPSCGMTMFKKSGRGAMKPFCINEACENFLPEDKRGYRKKPAASVEAADAEEAKAEKPKKKTTTKKTAAKTSAKKTKAKETAEE